MKRIFTTFILGLALTAILALSALSAYAAQELYFKLHVDTDAALSDALHKKMLQLNDVVFEQNLKSILLNQTPRGIEVRVDNVNDLKPFKTVLTSEFTDLRLDGGDRNFFTLSFTDQSAEKLKAAFMDQVRETIVSRLKLLDIPNAVVKRPAPDYLTIELKASGYHPELKSLLTQTALVEFKAVNTVQSEANLEDKAIAAGYEIAAEHPQFSGPAAGPVYVLQKTALLSGRHIIKAEPVYDRHYDDWWISIMFDNEGARLFEEITRDNLGRQLAIVLDGKVLAAPIIHEPITGGRAIIAGRFTEKEADNLAALIHAGSLPAPVSVVEERITGGKIHN